MFRKKLEIKELTECSYDLVNLIAMYRDFYHGFNCVTLTKELLHRYSLDQIEKVVAAAIHRRNESRNDLCFPESNSKWAEEICEKSKLPDNFRPLQSLDRSTLDVLASFLRNYEWEISKPTYLPDEEQHVMIVH